MSTGTKVFLSVAIGAFLGTLVGREMIPALTWVGTLVGGFVGYISYEFNKVLRAIPEAGRLATSWWPSKDWWKKCLRAALVSPFFVATCTLPLFLFARTLQVQEGGGSWTISLLLATIVGAFMASLISISIPEKGEDAAVKLRAVFITYNPVNLYLWIIPKGLVMTVWWLISHIPAGVKALGHLVVVVVLFFKHLAILIHSDVRLLCGVDAAIFATLGSFFPGNIILYALAGGLFGLANYEVVSKKWLKLVPEKA
jgi:hypothetical protein